MVWRPATVDIAANAGLGAFADQLHLQPADQGLLNIVVDMGHHNEAFSARRDDLFAAARSSYKTWKFRLIFKVSLKVSDFNNLGKSQLIPTAVKGKERKYAQAPLPKSGELSELLTRQQMPSKTIFISSLMLRVDLWSMKYDWRSLRDACRLLASHSSQF